jgi:hypothetical protein
LAWCRRPGYCSRVRPHQRPRFYIRVKLNDSYRVELKGECGVINLPLRNRRFTVAGSDMVHRQLN